jgi:hypothetical protein
VINYTTEVLTASLTGIAAPMSSTTRSATVAEPASAASPGMAGGLVRRWLPA